MTPHALRTLAELRILAAHLGDGDEVDLCDRAAAGDPEALYRVALYLLIYRRLWGWRPQIEIELVSDHGPRVVFPEYLSPRLRDEELAAALPSGWELGGEAVPCEDGRWVAPLRRAAAVRRCGEWPAVVR